MRPSRLLPALLFLAASCGRSNEAPSAATEPAADRGAAPSGPARPAPPAAQPAAGAEGVSPALAALRANEAEVAARPELPAQRVKVAHILVGYTGAPRMTIKDRSLEQAEVRAAELFERVQKGEDFEALMRSSSDDSGGGVYTMLAPEAPKEAGAFPRSGMVAAFGDVGWRLQVGQVGVAPHDPRKSPFGWHIIKRLE